MCASVFDKQIYVCFHEDVFPFNNKLTLTRLQSPTRDQSSCRWQCGVVCPITYDHMVTAVLLSP